MSDTGERPTYGHSLLDVFLGRAGKPKLTPEEKKELSEQRGNINGRTTPEKYRIELINFTRTVPFYLLLYFLCRLYSVVVFHQSLAISWSFIIVGCLGLACGTLLIPSARRLHDAGYTAWWVWVPGVNVYLLRKPSAPQHYWGDE